MAPALPQSVNLKLKQTLAQWPQWHCEPTLEQEPRVVDVLTSGLSNYSILVESRQRFVVRIDGINPATNGLNRQTEWRALKTAHRAGLAAGPRYFNPELGSLVCDYLAPDVGAQADPAQTALLLRSIHQLPARHHRLNLAERILRYEKLLAQRGRAAGSELKRAGDTVPALVHELNRHPADAVLCHNDLLQANRILSGGRLYAIDWEYCAMGSPWYDLAVIVIGDALDSTATETLLHTYLGRAPQAPERVMLYQYCCIYAYLELLWYLSLETPALDKVAIEAKSAALNTLLEHCVL